MERRTRGNEAGENETQKRKGERHSKEPVARKSVAVYAVQGKARDDIKAI